MTNETLKVIKSAIKSVAQSLNLTDYRRRKLQEAEIKNPAAWSSFSEEDNSHDACVQRYYSAIDAVYSERVSAAAHTNVMLDFKERLARLYNIYA